MIDGDDSSAGGAMKRVAPAGADDAISVAIGVDDATPATAIRFLLGCPACAPYVAPPGVRSTMDNVVNAVRRRLHAQCRQRGALFKQRLEHRVSALSPSQFAVSI
jgi:hypothetical protein